jgi:hypothetical protein
LSRSHGWVIIRVAAIGRIYSGWSSKRADFLTPPEHDAAEIRCYVGDAGGDLIEVGESTRG